MKRMSVFIGMTLLIASIAVPAAAQLTTATIHGKVANQGGTALPAAEIDAVNTASGFVKTVMSGPDGSYSMAGIQPGEYNLIIAAPGFQARNETVRILVGQNIEMNFDVLPDQNAHRLIAGLEAGSGDDEVVLAGLDAGHAVRAVRPRHHRLHEAAGRIDRVDLRGRKRRAALVRHLSVDRGRRQLSGSRHCDRRDQQCHSYKNRHSFHKTSPLLRLLFRPRAARCGFVLTLVAFFGAMQEPRTTG